MNKKVRKSYKNIKNNQLAFTLIELLATIIILGVIMLIAVPSVSHNIQKSKKDGYADSAVELTLGAKHIVYSERLNDMDTTYYIDGRCIKTDNAYRSPYGNFKDAYVAVIATEDSHKYFWMSVDEIGMGIKPLTSVDKLTAENVEEIQDENEIAPTIGIDGRNTIVVFDENCEMGEPEEAARVMNSKTGKIREVCPSSYTPIIYWALQDTTTDGYYDKLIISDHSVNGGLTGNFTGTTIYNSGSNVPWYSNAKRVTNIEIEGTVTPTSTAYWFYFVGSESDTFYADLYSLETCHVTTMNNMFNRTGRDAVTWELTGIEDWDTSSVTNMRYMFYNSGHESTNWKIDNLNKWDMSNVEDFYEMFYGMGYSASTFKLNLSDWDLSKVTSFWALFYEAGSNSSTFELDVSNWITTSVDTMRNMLYHAGSSATSWSIIGLNDWDTTTATNMTGVFSQAGKNAETFNIDISNWNMSNVVEITNMFNNAGLNAQNYSVIIPKTNGNGINNTTNRIYGSTSSIYINPTSGKSFTLAS